jgi:putative ABC transport system permease protein
MLAAFAEGNPEVESFSAAPMLRGSIAAINGIPAAELRPPSEDAARILVGEIPLTWSGPAPPRSEVVAGEWWPPDHDGEPLVSVFTELREPLGLELGDHIAFLIFGQTVEARVANFRDFPWRSGAVNFSFVLSPGALEGFPVTQLGLLRAVDGADREVQTALVEAFPELIFLPVGEALMALAGVLNSVTNAVAIIGGLSLVSGLFVLAGAMAAGRRQREADATVMKVLGATRGDVIRAYLVEYGLLGALSALLAVLLGLAGAWAFITLVLQLSFSVNLLVVGLVVAGAVMLTMAIGTLTTWAALSLRPATFLRAE